jgi:hypothetical protein
MRSLARLSLHRRSLASLASLAALAVASLAALGCDEPRGAPGSCFKEKDNVCIEFDAAQGAGGERLCAGYRWTKGAGTCPRDARLGTCTHQGQVEIVYGGAPNRFTPAAAKSVCESSGGTFAASR